VGVVVVVMMMMVLVLVLVVVEFVSQVYTRTSTHMYDL
jgi:hypothetical protein